MTFDEFFEARWPEFNHPKTSAREIWDAAQAAEREECAKVADRHSTCINDTPNVIATTIRARELAK